MVSADFAIAGAIVATCAVVATLLGWTVWLYSRRKQERLRAELEVRRRMLEKFATAEDLSTFLETDTGRRFLESLSTEENAQTRKILGSLKAGAVLTTLGCGLWLLVAWEPNDLAPMGIPATIALAIGLGFLASAWASYRLSRAWGLIPPPPR